VLCCPDQRLFHSTLYDADVRHAQVPEHVLRIGREFQLNLGWTVLIGHMNHQETPVRLRCRAARQPEYSFRIRTLGNAKVHLIHHTPEIEDARSRGALRTNSFIRLRKRVFEKVHAGVSRLSMMRMAAMSIMVSDVCTAYS
jgi:hypothetical protein